MMIMMIMGGEGRRIHRTRAIYHKIIRTGKMPETLPFLPHLKSVIAPVIEKVHYY